MIVETRLNILRLTGPSIPSSTFDAFSKQPKE